MYGMKKVGIFEAKTKFSALLASAAAGETIVVTNKGKPVARIVPLEREEPRTFGVARDLFASGAIAVAPDFDDPLPADMLRKLFGS